MAEVGEEHRSRQPHEQSHGQAGDLPGDQARDADPGGGHSGGGKAIVAAMSANLGIAVTKFVAYLLTHSSSMLAESIHSVADTGNQVLLIIGGRRARAEASAEHPFGQGGQRYVYGFLVSVVLFVLGGVFSLYEAWHKWHAPEPIEGRWWWVPLAVLAAAMVMEGFSLRTAIQESNQVRGHRSWAQFVRTAKAPELPVVLLEDFGALLGLVFAGVGVGMTIISGDGRWDAFGSGMIGVLLICVAAVLGREMGSLLVGEGASREHVRRIEGAITGTGGVQRLIHLRTLHLGPEELLVAAKIAVGKQQHAAEVARIIDETETAIRAAVPIAQLIYLEPDIDRGTAADGDLGTAPPPTRRSRAAAETD